MELREYTGHIRNWKKLCAELNIDTTLSREEREKEIIINAYKRWGYNIGNHIYGMFAFSIYDDKKDETFCIRDQFGTKPFYYYITEDGQLLCSYQIRNIMDKPGFKKELNEDILQIYLSLTYVAGEDTFFKGIKKLMPGYYMVFKNGQAEITRYFTTSFNTDDSKTLEEYADEIHSTLTNIMKEVKDENEKVESFLSGGVDSSYVLAVSDCKTANSCGYEEERFDESPLAAETARKLGVNHNIAKIQPEQFFNEVPYVMYNMEQPLGDASAIVFAIGCKEVAKHAQICYSGEGSDEFFGGYNMYRNAERYGENLKDFYVGNTNIMKEEEKKVILKNYNENILPINLVKDLYTEMEGLDPLTKMCNVDIKVWLEGDIYLNVDKMSRAAGLEVRMPLTDLRIFDIASRLPSKYKITETENKVAIRTAAAKVLPKEVAFRKKLGFIVPIRIWMADDRYNKDVREKLNSESAEKFFNKEEINKIFNDYINGDSDLWRKVWTIYTFLVWHDEYFVKR